MAIALLAAGLAVQVVGQVQQGNIAQTQAEGQASISEYNAAHKDVEAQQNLESAKMEEQRVARMARLFRGEQVAKMGMSGTDYTGSNIEVLGDIAYQTKLDRNLVLREGTIAGTQSRAEAAGDRFSARWSRLYGKQAKSASNMGAFGTAVSGGATIWGAMPMGR